jgi:hypothetical protein
VFVHPASAMILDPKTAPVLCDAIVDLISRVMRPYLFRVTVVGKPPHAYRRVYSIAANTEDSAAMKGIELFVKEFSPAAPVREMATLAPRAKLA